MSVVLALPCAGWVPVSALILPGLGGGGTEVVAPIVPTAVPRPVEGILLAFPTGWAIRAVNAAIEHSLPGVIAPLLGLVTVGVPLHGTWVARTARALKQLPAHARSNVSAAPGRLAVPCIGYPAHPRRASRGARPAPQSRSQRRAGRRALTTFTPQLRRTSGAWRSQRKPQRREIPRVNAASVRCARRHRAGEARHRAPPRRGREYLR